MKSTSIWQLTPLALMAALLVGCSKGASPATPTAAPAGSAPGLSLKRTIQRSNVANDLQQLGLFYQTYNTDFGRSPAKLEDLKPSIERDMPKLYESIENGTYVVSWGVRNLASNLVLAYEKEPDNNGIHYVLMGDGSVQRMNDEQLQTALKTK
jgi:hypothetical protein